MWPGSIVALHFLTCQRLIFRLYRGSQDRKVWCHSESNTHQMSSFTSLWQRQYGGINNNMAAGIRHMSLWQRQYSGINNNMAAGNTHRMSSLTTLCQRQYGGINNNMAAGNRLICHCGNGNMAELETSASSASIWMAGDCAYCAACTYIRISKLARSNLCSSHHSLDMGWVYWKSSNR
jgi:hypothetical protein